MIRRTCMLLMTVGIVLNAPTAATAVEITVPYPHASNIQQGDINLVASKKRGSKKRKRKSKTPYVPRRSAWTKIYTEGCAPGMRKELNRVGFSISRSQSRKFCRCVTEGMPPTAIPFRTSAQKSEPVMGPLHCRSHRKYLVATGQLYQVAILTCAASPTSLANSVGSWVPPSRPR